MVKYIHDLEVGERIILDYINPGAIYEVVGELQEYSMDYEEGYELPLRLIKEGNGDNYRNITVTFEKIDDTVEMYLPK